MMRTGPNRRLCRAGVSSFIEKPFQNSTYEGAPQIGAVVLRVSPIVSVDRLRRKLDEIVHQRPAMGRQSGEIGCDRHSHRCGGIACPGQRPHPAQAWSLCCEVRENLLEFL